MVDSVVCLIRNLNLMVSQRYSEAPLKCCRKSVKADVMCFMKALRNILKVPLLFSSVWQTDCVELAYCFTPLQSNVFKKKEEKGQACVKFENYFLQSSTSSIWILEKYAIKHWPAHGLCRTHDCSVGVSKQSLLGVSVGSWHGNYCLHFMLHRNSVTWSMANFHHHLKLCRQVEESRSSAHMWWMIKLDKWFALLNCPFQCDAH